MKTTTLRKLLTLVLPLVLIACSPAAVPPAETPVPQPRSTEPEAVITILAFGDSLTEGYRVAPEESYPAQLERKLRSDGYDVQVINGGISGETTSGALGRLDWMLNTQPDIVIVETGANDGLRGLDLAIAEANLDEIVGRFTEAGVVVIVAGMQIVQNLGSDYTDRFAAIYPAVAARHDSILIPFFLEGLAADPDLNQDDFIHPTAAGYTVMVSHMYPFVEEAIRQVGGGD